MPTENTSDLPPTPLTQSSEAAEKHWSLLDGGHLPSQRRGCPGQSRIMGWWRGPQSHLEALPTSSVCPGPGVGHHQGHVFALAGISQRSSWKPSGGGRVGRNWCTLPCSIWPQCDEQDPEEAGEAATRKPSGFPASPELPWAQGDDRTNMPCVAVKPGLVWGAQGRA